MPMRAPFCISIYLFAIVTLQADTPLHERIDGLIREKAGGHSFSGVCDDATFLRRVTLDLTGNIPAAGEVLAFLKDQSPNKRKELIDRLITGDLFAGHRMGRCKHRPHAALAEHAVDAVLVGDHVARLWKLRPGIHSSYLNKLF